MATPAWISLGSNLGDRAATLDAALAALAETPGVAVRAVSTYHETAPVGGPDGQGTFLNAAAHLETTLGPFELLDALQAIEARFGRVRAVRWGERTLDLDLLIFGTKFLDTRRLKVPHTRLALRRFVLAPLAEIAPYVIDVVSRRSIGDLLANLDRRPRWIALDGPPGRRKEAVFRLLVADLPAIPIEGAEDDLEPVEDRPTTHRQVHSIDRKLDLLGSMRPESHPVEPSWHLADFDLRSDLIRSVIDVGPAGWQSREVTARLRDAVKASPAPTFAVILPGPKDLARKPWLGGPPRLWPESDKPEAIVAEVLATCRGIEGP